MTTCNIKNYIKRLEQGEVQNSEQKEVVFSCFVPMLALAVLWLFKITCFKVKNTYIQLSISISLFSIAFACESRFDNEIENAPLFIVAIPISLILLIISFDQLLAMKFEPDECVALFNSYDSKCKWWLSVINVFFTIAYVGSSIVALYYLE